MSVGLGSSQLNGRNGAPATSSYVVIGADGALTNERQLTGTANQVIVTDNGAGSTVVLSTPQNIHTAASPTFAGLTLSGLTADRVPYTTTGGLLATGTDLIYDGTNGYLTVGNASSGGKRIFARHNWTPQTTTAATDHEVVRAVSTTAGGGTITEPHIGFSAWMTDSSPVNKTITGAANNGSGLIRITATSHGFTTGDRVGIYGVTGTTEANGAWNITVINANTFDLQGSTFANAYVSGGTASTRSQLVGSRVILQLDLDRSTPGTGTAFNDDANGYTVQSSGAGKATDAFYVAGNPTMGGASAWYTLYSGSANADYFLRFDGKAYLAGLDLSSATYNGSAAAIALGAGGNISLDTVTGTKIGTSTSQKLGFFNATPIVQNTSTTDLRTGLINLGFFASGGASPLNLNGGTLTAGAGVISGDLTVDTDTLYADSTNNRVGIGTASPAGVLHIVEESSENPTADKWFSGTGAMSWQMRKGRGSVAAPRRAQSGDVLGGFLAFGAEAADDVSTAAFPSGAAGNFRFITTEAHTTTAHGTKLTIQTAAISSTTLTQRIQIDEWGLRIGSSPASRGTTQGTNQLELYDGTAPAGTLTNGVALFSASGKLKSADAAGTVGHVVAASAVNTVSPTAPNRTITVDIGGTTYYIHAKTTND